MTPSNDTGKGFQIGFAGGTTTAGATEKYGMIRNEIVYRVNGAPQGDMIFSTYGSGAEQEGIRIEHEGKVGIRQTAPDERLDVNGCAVFSGDNAVGTNAQNYAHGIMLASVSGQARISPISNGSNDVSLQIGGLNNGTRSDYQLQCWANGNVTCNHDNQVASFSVNGDDNVITTSRGSPLASNQNWNGTAFGHVITRKAGIFFERQGSYSVGRLNFCMDNTGDSTSCDNSDRAFSLNSNKTMDFAYAVSIGGQGPDKMLHVADAGSVHSLFESTGDANSFMMFQSNSSTDNQQVRIGANGNDMILWAGDNERMRILSGGNVGIGVTAPGSLLHLYKSSGNAELKLESAASGDPTITFDSVNNRTGDIKYTDGTTTAKLTYDHADLSFKFCAHNQSSAAADLVVNESTSYFPGNTAIGATSTQAQGTGTYSARFRVVQAEAATSRSIAIFENADTATPAGVQILYTGAAPNNGAYEVLKFGDTTSHKMFCWSNGGFVNVGGSYGSLSDRVLKQDITAANSQWDDVKALTALGKNFRMKADVVVDGDDAPTLLGLVAQDVEAISPGLVEHNTESSFPHRQLKDSVMYMKAFFALGEAMNRIEALEAKVAALEAG